MCNQLLLDLRRGPVLASEIKGDAVRIVRDLNKYVLAEIGWKITSRKIKRPSKWGLKVTDLVYTLVWTT